MCETNIDPRFRSEAPRLREVGPHRTMTVEGEPLTAQYGKYPFASAEFLAALARGMQRFKQARLAGFDAESRLRDMDEGGVDVQILHPTVGAQLLGRELKNPELLAACCRAYNDWSAEYCGAAPQRRRWAPNLPIQNNHQAHQDRQDEHDHQQLDEREARPGCAVNAGPRRRGKSQLAGLSLHGQSPLRSYQRPCPKFVMSLLGGGV